MGEVKKKVMIAGGVLINVVSLVNLAHIHEWKQKRFQF